LPLLEADVNLSVVRISLPRSRSRLAPPELSGALNPAQQVIKIVSDELVTILGGETRVLRYAKRPPTMIMLAGLQGSGKTTLAAKLGLWLKEQGHSPLLVAADLQRPNAVGQLQVVGQRAGVHVFAPEPGNTSSRIDRSTERRPVAGRASVGEAERRLYDVVIVDTCWPARHRRRDDAASSRHPRCRASGRGALRRRRHDRPGRGQHC
jgi:signal recognition particle subunit SRP54